MPMTLDRLLRQKALRLLALREHSRAELRQKLTPLCRKLSAAGQAHDLGADLDANANAPAASHGGSVLELLEQVLQDLEDQGCINAERYAQNWVQSNSQRYGRVRIQHELKRKGIDQTTADRALAHLAADDVERAWQLWHRRFGSKHSTPPTDAAADCERSGRSWRRSNPDGPQLPKWQEQGRQMRFLQGRGFSDEVIRAVLKRARQSAAYPSQTPDAGAII